MIAALLWLAIFKPIWKKSLIAKEKSLKVLKIGDIIAVIFILLEITFGGI